MTYTRQTLANSAKDPIPGLHRPPGHSTLRSSEHMQYMCPEESVDELDQSTLLVLLLSVFCASHVHSMPRPHGCNDESLCSPMLIENISPQMDSDCTRLTRADHTVSTSTRGEYGALSMARAAGGLEAVPMACNARICSVAAPFHQCSTHGLPGLQRRPELKARPQSAGDH